MWSRKYGSRVRWATSTPPHERSDQKNSPRPGPTSSITRVDDERGKREKELSPSKTSAARSDRLVVDYLSQQGAEGVIFFSTFDLLKDTSRVTQVP